MADKVDILRERAAARHDYIKWEIEWLAGRKIITVEAKSGEYSEKEPVVADAFTFDECDDILNRVARELVDSIEDEFDKKTALQAEGDRRLRKLGLANSCCSDFTTALQDETDPEGYGPAVTVDLQMGRTGRFPPIRFCPWCGAKKELKPIEEKEPK